MPEEKWGPEQYRTDLERGPKPTMAEPDELPDGEDAGDREKVNTAYRAAYEEHLSAMNRKVAVAKPLNDRLLEEARAALNKVYDLSRERPEEPAGLLARLATRFLRPLVRRLSDPWIANQQEFNSALVAYMNHRAALDRQLWLRQQDWNVRTANFGQKIVPVVDEKIRWAYDTLDKIILRNVERTLERMDLMVGGLDREHQGLNARIGSLTEWLTNNDQRLENLSGWLENTGKSLEQFQAALDRAVEEYRHGLVGLSRRMTEPAPVGPEGASTPAGVAEPARDRWMEPQSYTLFEADCRGSSQDLEERFEQYRGDLEGRERALDLGCGRGEMLTLLARWGVEAVGVDSNPGMVELARQKGHRVEHGDAIAYLREQPEGSLDAVFAAQVVEHLPSRSLETLLWESHRVLRSGGVMLLETINPTSLHALVSGFFRDPTHVFPVHPDTLAFLTRTAGFPAPRVRYLSPIPEKARLPEAPPADLPEEIRSMAEWVHQGFMRINGFLYGPQDYALDATKP